MLCVQLLLLFCVYLLLLLCLFVIVVVCLVVIVVFSCYCGCQSQMLIISVYITGYLTEWFKPSLAF